MKKNMKELKNNDFLIELGCEIIKKIIENEFTTFRHHTEKKVFLTDHAKLLYEDYIINCDYPNIPENLILLDSWNYTIEINDVFELIDFGYVE